MVSVGRSTKGSDGGRRAGTVLLPTRIGDLWPTGVPVARLAAAVGLAITDAPPPAAGSGPAHRRDDELAELRRLYLDERLPAAEVAARLGVSVAAVQSRLRRAGIRRQPAAPPPEQVRSLYEAGLSIRAIGAQLSLHHRTVWRALDEAGVELRPRGAPGVVLSKRQLERLYLSDGLSLAEIGRLFEVSPHIVARNLDRHGIPRQRAPLDRVVLEELYVEQRLGIRAVAAGLGVSATMVRAGLAHHGIAIRRPGRPGAA